MSTDPVIDPAHTLPAASTLRRSRFRWRIVAFVALIAAILAVAGRFATENGLSGDQIARVVIDGTITTDAGRLAVLEALAKNDTVKAVVVAINSPGGTTAAGLRELEKGGLRAAADAAVAAAKMRSEQLRIT